MLSLLLLSVGAFTDTSQHKTNVLLSEHGNGSVILTKIGIHEDETVIESGLSGAVFSLFKISDDEPLNIGGPYYTDESGIIEVHGLRPGKYYFEELSSPNGYDFSKDSNGNSINRFPFEISTEKEHIPYHLDIVNIRQDGELTLEKTVSRYDDDSLSQEEKDRVFDFKVTFGEKVDNPSAEDSNEYSYTINGKDILKVKNGGIIKLKHGEKARFKYLKYGLRYSVEEIIDDTYYVTSTNSNGIHLNETNVSFNNEIQPEKKGMLIFNKIVTPLGNHELPDDAYERMFEFKITFNDGGTYDAKIMDGSSIKVKSGDTFKLKHGDIIMFYDLPLGLNYSVEEYDYQNEGYYPETSKLEGTIGDNTKPVRYTFNNKYQDPLTPPVNPELNLDITKEVINPYKNEDTFEFKVFFDPIVKDLQYKIDDGPFKTYTNGEVISIRHLETIHFVGVPVGTRYRIEELPKEDYESLTKTSSGTLVDQNVDITFYNHYIGKEATQGYLEIHKVVKNKETQEKFDFVLTLDNEVIEFSLKDGEMASYYVPEGTKYSLVEKDYSDSGYVVNISNAQGIVKRGETLEIIATNTYNKELDTITLKGNKTWITNTIGEKFVPEHIKIDIFDGNGSKVETLTVNPDKNGQWNYEVKLPKFNDEGKEIKYSIKEQEVEYFEASYDCFNIVNRYIAPVIVTPKVNKKIVGENLPKDQTTFTFFIEALNGAPIQSKNPVIIKGEGNGEFDSIEINKPGTYQYIIREDQVRDSEYDYDKTPVIMTVEIVKEGDSLKLLSIKYEKGIEESSEFAQFINIYKGKSTEPEKPSKPVDPEKPIEPENPTGPTENEKPLKPGDPENPSKPTNPEKPNNPGKPGTSGGNQSNGKLPHTGIAPTYYNVMGLVLLLIGIEFILISMKKHVKTLIK